MTEIENLIVSSRVRLARNLEGIPFKTKTKGAFEGIAATIKAKNRGYVSIAVTELGMAPALTEQHLISRELLNNKVNSMIVASPDNKVVVMLGEEDHVRIQSIQVGMNLQTAYDAAKKIAGDIEAEHNIARRDDFGYITSCPTNLGTGMRASVMMFLPALTLAHQIDLIINQLAPQHIAVRGVYGEGSTADGFMYQISNQACFGTEPEEILRRVNAVTVQLAKLELDMQAKMYKESRDAVTDRVMRSWGILTNAYMISSAESVEHLAVLKLGACLGIITFKNVRVLDDLFFITQPKTLTTVDERAADVISRDKIRAAKISEILRVSRIK